jgi:hypothetical protein
MANNMTPVPIIDDSIQGLPHSTIPTIQGHPTFRQLREAHQLINANIIFVESYNGDGNLGRLGFIISPVEYERLPPGTPFNSPTNPGVTPIIQHNALPTDKRRHRDDWATQVHAYKLYSNVEKALKKLIINMVAPMKLQARAHRIVQFANITVHNLILHFQTTYGKITSLKLEANEDVDSALSPGTPAGHHANSAMTGKPSTATKWLCLARTLFHAPHLTSLSSHKLS